MANDPAPAPPRAKGDQVSLFDSFRRLATWLKEHDAAVLMQSLSPAAKPVALSKLEGKLGFSVPPGLRALWLLHDGQRRAADTLIGELQLLPVAWVLNERAATLKLLARMREVPDHQKQTGMTRDESRSDEWLTIASRGAERVLVHSGSGRVFASIEAAPYLQLVGPSVPQWLKRYVDAVERGDYQLVFDPEGAFLRLASGENEEDED